MSGQGARVRALRLWPAWLTLWAALFLGSPSAAAEPSVFPIPFHIIAHRGASAYAPENTLPAFERALELGAFEVELDVRMSRDGQLFLFHDTTLDEKTDGKGRFSEASSARLRRLDIGSWFDRVHLDRPPRHAGTGLITLSELFAHFGGRLFYHVEIKARAVGVPAQIVRQVREAKLGDRVIVTSFLLEQLRRVRELDAELPLWWLVKRKAQLAAAAEEGLSLLELQRRALATASAEGFAGVGIAASDISPEIVAIGHQAGLEVRGWGVKNEALMERVIASGANGMTVDWPDRLIRRLLRHTAGMSEHED
jgi:glycerophosphoryl diester phosphodiesterase